MPLTWFRRLWILAAAIGLACVPTKPPVVTPGPPPVVTRPIAVVVHDAATGAPIVNAIASLTLADGTIADCGTCLTNSDGYLLWNKVKVGLIGEIKVSREGYSSAQGQAEVKLGAPDFAVTLIPNAPPVPTWAPTRAQLMDIQGDLMIWAPEVGCAPEANINCGAARGLAAGWIWGNTINRFNATNREKIYQAVLRQGYTHVQVQVVCDGGEGYHGLTPDDCVNYGPKTQAVINELKAHQLIPICAGVSPTAKLADGIDPASCPIAMNDWDNSADADARIRAIGDTFPRDTLLYMEMPTDNIYPILDPGTTPIGIAPTADNGGHWIMGVQQKYPNFVGVLYEFNTPDGVASNLASLAKANAWWRDIQQVWFESDTYWKFWDALDINAQRTYNDAIMRQSPQLKGCMSGCSSHPVIPDAPAGTGALGTTLDMHTAVIEADDSSIADWAVTTTITALDLLPTGVHVEFDKLDGANRWPDTPDYSGSGGMGPLQYSIGVCYNIAGTWHCSAPIELWYGLHANGGNVGEPGQLPTNWFYARDRWGAMSGYQPKPGELVGFYVVAGDARNHVTVVRERSAIVLVPFPTASGTIYR